MLCDSPVETAARLPNVMDATTNGYFVHNASPKLSCWFIVIFFNTRFYFCWES